MENNSGECQQKFGTLSAQVDEFMKSTSDSQQQLRQSQVEVKQQMAEILSFLKSSRTGNPHQLDFGDPPPLTQPLRPALVHLDVPRFDGEDPYSWMFQIEQYFAYHNTPEAQRLQIVAFHLDGKASTWFQWLKSQNLPSSWSDFLSRVQSRFGASQFDDPEGKLAKLTQQDSVVEYQS